MKVVIALLLALLSNDGWVGQKQLTRMQATDSATICPAFQMEVQMIAYPGKRKSGDVFFAFVVGSGANVTSCSFVVQ